MTSCSARIRAASRRLFTRVRRVWQTGVGLFSIALVAVFILLSAAPFLSLAPAASGPAVSTPTPVPVSVLLRGPYLQLATETGISIIWTTGQAGASEVRYAGDPSYSEVAEAVTTPFNATGAPYDAYYVHRVDLTGLSPDLTYRYQVWTGGVNLLPNAQFRFHTARPRGRAFTFLDFGDSGANTSSQRALRDQMMLQPADVIVQNGDVAYNAGTYYEYETKVFAIYRDLFANVAAYHSPGNHDYGTSSAAPYRNVFYVPANAWRAGDAERYYSFDYGDAHFVALDTNTPLAQISAGATDDMADWLAADLAATTLPWKIVYFHHPAYSTGPHGDTAAVIEHLVPIFEAYNVDLVLQGHDHTYERTYALRNGIPAADGVTYIVSGGGGASLYSFARPLQPFDAYRESVYHFLKVDVGQCVLRGQAIAADGHVVDAMRLNRCPGGACTLDLNADNVIDIVDVQLVAAHLGSTGAADLTLYNVNADNEIDILDVAAVASGWQVADPCAVQPLPVHRARVGGPIQ